MFDRLLLLALIGSFSFFWLGRMDGDELFTLHALILVSVLSFFFPVKREIPLKRLGSVLLIVFISTFLNFTIPVRIGLFNMTFGCLAIKAMAERTELNFTKIGLLLAPFSALCFLGMQLQALGIGMLGYDNQVAAVFAVPWLMGCFAVLAIPFIAAVHPSICLVLLPLLICSKSTLCLFAGALVFLLSVFGFQKKYLALAVILAGLAGFFYLLAFDGGLQNFRGFDRFEPWIASAKYIKNPLTGNGLGSFAHEGFRKLNGAQWEHWRWAHNEFYQHYFEQGAAGLAAAFVWLVGLFLTKDRYARAFLTGICILALFHPIFHFGKLIFFLLLGIAVLIKEKHLAQSTY